MQTSLRYGGDSKALRIHAKEKFPIDSKFHLQVHGELDTGVGTPNCFALIIRNFFPEISASTGLGFRYDKDDKLRYNMRVKKAFPITSNGLLSFNAKGSCDFDEEFKKSNARGAAELTWGIINFQKDQDVRLKVGYEVFDKVPYFQVRENNWTLNGDINGRWNIKFDL
ncbi:outer envelope pore protein 21B, chloroplastic-like [Tasmannia lanceolata]|uniref:outer envelope pore protein 21B, chloroplastic-like n=1 Tax=Tasmannia lanceolata TaxID=3420 RepID=UPI004062AB95